MCSAACDYGRLGERSRHFLAQLSAQQHIWHAEQRSTRVARDPPKSRSCILLDHLARRRPPRPPAQGGPSSGSGHAGYEVHSGCSSAPGQYVGCNFVFVLQLGLPGAGQPIWLTLVPTAPDPPSECETARRMRASRERAEHYPQLSSGGSDASDLVALPPSRLWGTSSSSSSSFPRLARLAAVTDAGLEDGVTAGLVERVRVPSKFCFTFSEVLMCPGSTEQGFPMPVQDQVQM